MRLSLCIALFFFAAPGFAQDNALTPKEAVDGWLLLFDGESNYGWRGDGKIEAKDRSLVITGDPKKSTTVRSSGPFSMFDLQYQHKLNGENLTGVFQNHQLMASRSWVSTEIKGRGDMLWVIGDGAKLFLKDIKIRPQEMQPLFNGKDLIGWKEFPGKKSKFSVNADGEINIKDGPGDLQTVAKYDDFILQLECLSNGKNLNSGVFFRCRANEYQNGYEVQIRNQFTKEPTQDYVLEEYDPQTHKLLAKKKAKFTAVDYGTGAIYRRQPARKEVSKDGEWFTLTILAHKNHFMTWVNGIQVADFVDNRPPNDNARNGYRQEAGHISLQGHDPTTDLSFRNIRIAEIK